MITTIHYFAIACALPLAAACASPEEQTSSSPTRSQPASFEDMNQVRTSNDGLKVIIRPSHAWVVRCDLTDADDVCVLFGAGEADSGDQHVQAWGNEVAARRYAANVEKVVASGESLMHQNLSYEALPAWLVARRLTSAGDLESPVARKALPPVEGYPEGYSAAYAFDFEARTSGESAQIILKIQDALLIDLKMYQGMAQSESSEPSAELTQSDVIEIAKKFLKDEYGATNHVDYRVTYNAGTDHWLVQAILPPEDQAFSEGPVVIIDRTGHPRLLPHR